METPATRLQLLMTENNLNQVELAEKIGKTKSLISGYLNPKNKPSDIFLHLLEDKLGWSARWIRTGAGPKRINQIPKTNGQIGDIVDGEPELGIFTTGNIGSIRPNFKEYYKPVRLLSARAQMGIPSMTHETFNLNWLDETYPVFMPTITLDEKHLVIEVVGESMLPEIKDRTLVLAESVVTNNIKYQSGGVYAVLYAGNNFVVKRIKTNEINVNGTLRLWSDNEMYGHIDIHGEDIIHMWKLIKKVSEAIR